MIEDAARRALAKHTYGIDGGLGFSPYPPGFRYYLWHRVGLPTLDDVWASTVVDSNNVSVWDKFEPIESTILK